MSAEARPVLVPVDEPAKAVGPRFAGLEAYRGIAAVLVVLFHVYQLIEQQAPGSVGGDTAWGYRVLTSLDGLVGLFFVLSGFLIFLPYARAVLGVGDAPSARAFLVRRAARVVPLYLVAILVVWTARNWGLADANWRDLIEHLTFTHVYDNERIFFTIGPAWSLAVEVQFYVLLALVGMGLTALAPRLSQTGRRLLIVGTVTALFAVSLGYKMVAWLVWEAPADDWKVWFGLPAKLDEFAAGMALAIVVVLGKGKLGRLGTELVRVVGLVILGISLWQRPIGQGEHAWFHTAAGLGFMLLLWASVLGVQDWWSRFLSTRALVFLGIVSYSLYLWHEPLLLGLESNGLLPGESGLAGLAINLAIALPLAIGVAWLSYTFIERPGNALRGLIDRQGKARDYYNGE